MQDLLVDPGTGGGIMAANCVKCCKYVGKIADSDLIYDLAANKNCARKHGLMRECVHVLMCGCMCCGMAEHVCIA